MKADRKEGMRKCNWKMLCPVIHMIISIVYGVFFFRHEEWPFGLMLPANDIKFSEAAERAAHILMSGLFGFILICMVWYVFFMLIKKKRKLPFILVVLSFLVCLLIFPSNFSYEPDNLVSYAFAIRNIPDYWQSIYLGCLYRACLYVFPHPISIPFIQFSSLLGVIYYISIRTKRLFGKKASYLPWLTILFPEFLELGTNPYRNCIYTVMCLWFFAVLLFDYLEKRKRTTGELVLFCIFGGVLTIFRSEGIVLWGVLVAGLLLIYGLSVRELWKMLAAAVCICLILAFPQKMGEKKYYGKDYNMINSMNMLKTILTDKNVNLKYDTVEEDLTAINQIVSLKGLIVYGIHEYRADNFVKKNTVNQSFASEEQQNAFIKGTRNLILHNKGLFLKDRFAMFCEANGISPAGEDPYPTEEWNQMFSVLVSQWNYSYNEIITDSYPAFLLQNRKKVEFSDLLTDIQIDYYNLICRKGLLFISRILVFLLLPFLVLFDMKLNDKKGRLFFVWTAFFLLIQLSAIVLVCPEGRGVYYYPSFFVILFCCFLLSLDIVKKSRKVKTILPPVTHRL